MVIVRNTNADQTFGNVALIFRVRGTRIVDKETMKAWSLIPHAWRGISTGIGVGSIAGLLESGYVMIGLPSLGEMGNLAFVTIAIWILIGAVTGLVVISFGGKSSIESSTVAIRTATLLLVYYTGVMVNKHLLPSVFHWKSITFDALLLLFALAIWIVAGRLSYSFPGTSKRRWFLSTGIILAFFSLFAGLAVSWLSHSVREVELSRYQPGPIPPPTPGTPPELMVIGLDSATWSIIDPLIEEGKMPNLQRLRDNGAFGVLRSYEISESPVVWTSIFTGKTPDKHGISSFTVAISSNRRVKAVWEIAEENGKTSAVVNVPGTYPASCDCRALLAGFPMPSASYYGKGWFLTTGKPPADGVILPVPLDNAIPVAGGTRESSTRMFDVQLKELPASCPSGKTSWSFMLRLLVGFSRSQQFQARTVSVDFGRLQLFLTESSVGSRQMKAVNGSGDELFRIAPGEWSGWLTAGIMGSDYNFKVKYLETDPDEISLFVTPYYLPPDRGIACPEALAPVINGESPYVAEGVGWQVFQEERLLGALVEHLMEVDQVRLTSGLALLEHIAPDLYIHIITVTDRLQHPMMKFYKPEVYLELATARGGEYGRFRPIPRLIDEYGPVISQTFIEADKWIGRLLEKAGPFTNILIVSDHGAGPGPHGSSPTAGIHTTAGIYLMSGPNIKSSGNTAGPELVLEDITPAILGLLSLPTARDMNGRLPDMIIPSGKDGTLPDPVDTYESRDGMDGDGKIESVDGPIEEQLRSLGYLK